MSGDLWAFTGMFVLGGLISAFGVHPLLGIVLAIWAAAMRISYAIEHQTKETKP